MRGECPKLGHGRAGSRLTGVGHWLEGRRKGGIAYAMVGQSTCGNLSHGECRCCSRNIAQWTYQWPVCLLSMVTRRQGRNPALVLDYLPEAVPIALAGLWKQGAR